MLFSSNIFLFLFLPITLIGYYLLHKPYRNAFLLLMSLIFYAWGEPKFVFVMMAVILWNYITALMVDRLRKMPLLCKLTLALSIVGNLGVLMGYKYLGFITSNLNGLGIPVPIAQIALPIGISFFTFQAMSYMVDVYRGTVKVQYKPHYVALYVTFFPQLIAGPIVRYQTIEDELDGRKETLDDFAYGVRRFLIGFGKKILNYSELEVESLFYRDTHKMDGYSRRDYKCYINENAPADCKLMSIGDSFGRVPFAFFPLCIQTCEELDMRDYTDNFAEHYNEYKPNIIIQLINPGGINDTNASYNFFNE